ncbi:NAD(P)H azoreductase [Pandoraea eparura]|jgi:hypothetical protein|uniref:NAD(P)H azoreductase n=1 Tax=Pandoraea eparura TaxID=2508291 RepID=A0A5E4VJ56_9BURK|nr:NAD(P)H azoreductase [Pandoraea eparura]
MYTVMGITVRVGCVLGHDLLKAGLPLRVVVPDTVKSSRRAALARALVRDVCAEAVPRAGWDPLFRAQGMRNPLPRIQMLDGFNNGDFRFRDDGKHALRGGVTLVEAIAALVRKS